MPTSWTFALLLLFTCHRTLNTLDKDKELGVSSDFADKRNVLGFEAFVGIGKENPSISQSFEHNFGKKETIVGKSDAVGWGITCDTDAQKTTNTCVFDKNAKDQEGFYFDNKYTYKAAELYLRFFTNEKLDAANKPKLPVRLVTATTFWPVNKLGVIGLSPTSDFATYFRSIYDGDTSLLFGYTMTNPEATNEKLKFDNHVAINPVSSPQDVVTTITVPTGSDFWTTQADVTIAGSDISYPDTKLCFVSSANELILVVDNIVQCDRVRAATCGADKAITCTKADADMQKAPLITIKIGNVPLTFKGDQYIFFNEKGNLSCRFGDLSSLSSGRVCPEGTEVAVGRTFFAYNYPWLTFYKDKSPTMAFLSKYNFKPHPKPIGGGGIGIWWILVIIAAIIAIGGGVYYYIKKRNSVGVDEQNYVNL